MNDDPANLFGRPDSRTRDMKANPFDLVQTDDIIDRLIQELEARHDDFVVVYRRDSSHPEAPPFGFSYKETPGLNKNVRALQISQMLNAAAALLQRAILTKTLPH